MSKKYYWLKLKKDFFDSLKVKTLRKVAGGDTYTIIYLKMMLLSINDEGLLFFEHVQDNLFQELALILNEDENNVEIVCSYLIKNGLMTTNKNMYLLTIVPELIGSETSAAQRKRAQRKRDILKCDNVTTKSQEVTQRREELDNFSQMDKQLLVGMNNKDNKKNNFDFLDNQTEKELKDIEEVESAIESLSSEVIH